MSKHNTTNTTGKNSSKPSKGNRGNSRNRRGDQVMDVNQMVAAIGSGDPRTDVTAPDYRGPQPDVIGIKARTAPAVAASAIEETTAPAVVESAAEVSPDAAPEMVEIIEIDTSSSVGPETLEIVVPENLASTAAAVDEAPASLAPTTVVVDEAPASSDVTAASAVVESAAAAPGDLPVATDETQAPAASEVAAPAAPAAPVAAAKKPQPYNIKDIMTMYFAGNVEAPPKLPDGKRDYAAPKQLVGILVRTTPEATPASKAVRIFVPRSHITDEQIAVLTKDGSEGLEMQLIENSERGYVASPRHAARVRAEEEQKEQTRLARRAEREAHRQRKAVALAKVAALKNLTDKSVVRAKVIVKKPTFCFVELLLGLEKNPTAFLHQHELLGDDEADIRKRAGRQNFVWITQNGRKSQPIRLEDELSRNRQARFASLELGDELDVVIQMPINFEERPTKLTASERRAHLSKASTSSAVVVSASTDGEGGFNVLVGAFKGFLPASELTVKDPNSLTRNNMQPTNAHVVDVDLGDEILKLSQKAVA